jgi:hypothetical protein
VTDIAPGSSLIGRGDRIVVNLFGDATGIARALGLDIELPDSDNEDPAYWERVHADCGYKRRIDGRIADPWWNGDPDWSLLLRLPWGEVWFDIEEGVKLFLVADDIPRALLLIENLRAKGVRLIDETGKSLVWFSCTRFDDDVLARVRERLEAAGLVHGLNEIVWELPPERR